jgi:hypothetical protein
MNQHHRRAGMKEYRPRFKVGDKFQLSKDALDNYGEEYAGKTFTVRAVYTHYVPAAKMESDPSGHPGFDEAGGSCLYGSQELNFDVYEWEMRRA